MMSVSKKSAYKTGVRTRELLLKRLVEYGCPADVLKLAELTGMDKRHIRYTIDVMLALGTVHLHHWEKNKSNRAKAFYFTEPNKQVSRKIINNIF